MSFGGRWVWRPINNEDRTFHVGAAFRYANIATGVVENNVLKTELDLGSSLETYVDATQDFLSAKLPWAKNVFDTDRRRFCNRLRYKLRGKSSHQADYLSAMLRVNPKSR